MSAEQNLKIPLADGKCAYARLRGDWSQPLIIFAHGNSANMMRVLPHEASKFLHAHGYAVLRFNFYDDPADAHKLLDMTLSTQVRDLAAIIASAQQHATGPITLMGHSFGALTILMSIDLNIDSAILLDPSYPSRNSFRTTQYIKELDTYHRPDRGVSYLIGRAMINEYQNLKPHDFLTLYHTPTLIIAAGEIQPGHEEYYKILSEKHIAVKLVTVPNADHGFSTDEAMEQLLAHSLQWLQERSTP